MADSAGDKTEKPTPKKLQDARKRGEVPKSQDLSESLSMLAGLLVTMALVPWFARQVAGLFLAVERAFEAPDPSVLKALLLEGLGLAALASLAPLLTAAAVSMFSLWLQTGTVLSLDPVMPKMERINPAAGFKRIVSIRTVVQLAQMLLKTALLGAAVVLVCRQSVPDAIRVLHADAGAALAVAHGALMHLMLWCGGLFVVMGAADLGYQRWQFLRDQRMDLQEVRREHRESNGDPQIKSARAQAAQEPPWEELVSYLRYASLLVQHQDGRLVAVMYRARVNPAPLALLRARGAQSQEVLLAAQRHKIRRLADDALLEALYPGAAPGAPVAEPHAATIIACLRKGA
jgi:flagellar biosynthesis protein FlhB